MVYDILILLIIILIILAVIIDLQELVINMIYGILIIVVLISIILGLFIDISDFDDNNDRYQEVYMKIKRIQAKAYYSYCNECNKSLDSEEKYMYDGYCRNCYYERRIF